VVSHTSRQPPTLEERDGVLMVVEELPAKVDVVDELAATKGPNPPIWKLRRLDVQIWELPAQIFCDVF